MSRRVASGEWHEGREEGARGWVQPPGGSRPAPAARARLLLAVPLLVMIGCHSLSLFTRDKPPDKPDAPQARPGALARPEGYAIRVAPYVFHSDFEIRRDWPLFVELAALRDGVQKELLLPPSTAQVDVYLFETEERYQKYMKEHYPELPKRRAFFMAVDRPMGGGESLLVFTYWGERIRQDLRHELTHALLHSVIKEVPLWLDEGLAEYFELPPERQGVNPGHLEHLRRALAGPYRPDLARLEGLDKVSDMQPAEYREAWAWVHLMLRSTPEAKTALLSYLQQLRGQRSPGKLRPELVKIFTDLEGAFSEHVLKLEAPVIEARAEQGKVRARASSR